MYSAKPQSEKAEIVTASKIISEHKVNEQNQTVARNGRTGSDSSFSGARSQVDASTSFFEIDPGITPATSMPVHQVGRKSLEEPMTAPNQKQQSDPMKSGGRNTTLTRGPIIDRNKEPIRTTETKGKFPFELLALLTVVLAGVCAVISTQMPSDPVPVVIQRKIASGELDQATSLMESWRLSVKQTQEEDYWTLADALGKAYFEHKDYAAAGRWFEAVPDKSKASAEAHRYLLKVRKAVP